MTIMIRLLLASLCLSVTVRSATAVNPPPDGGYPNHNTAEGDQALFNLLSGIDNTASGYQALFSNTTGNDNTATGFFALLKNTSGSASTATGAQALFSNTTGDNNTANGYQALQNNASGANNTASGFRALRNNTIGGHNTATGIEALGSNTTGHFNTANGAFALLTNTSGVDNTATGIEALGSNTTGKFNTANGAAALFTNTTGSDNTAAGYLTLEDNTTGGGNTAIGNKALSHNTTGVHNTACGVTALENSTGDGNVALGVDAGSDLTTGNNNIDIGYRVKGQAGESNTIRIGNADIADTIIRGIFGASSGGATVFVNNNGKLGTLTSSRRFKDEIKPMGDASDAILGLRPVSFRYKKEIDPEGVQRFGLIAEEVAKVSPDLIIRDVEGKPQTVRYEQINAMLLNEFLKEHKAFVAEQGKVKELQAMLAQQQKEIDALTAGLQKVSAQLATASPSVGGIEVTNAGPTTVSLSAIALREGGGGQ